MDENPQQPQWQPVVSPDAHQQSNSDYPEIPPVSWSASEFISHQKNSSWYLILGVGSAIATFLVVLVSGSIISGLVVAFAAIVLGIYAARQPATKRYVISDYGIQIDDKSFPYEMFKSFSVVPEGAVDSIWLRPLKRYMPTIVMYFSPEDGDKIIDTLENFLPEEDRALDTMDRLSRRMRF